MNRLLAFVLVGCLLLLPAAAFGQVNQTYTKNLLTGGTAYTLDGIAYASLNDGDIAYVTDNDALFFAYTFEGTSGASEDVPFVITPDDQSGNGRWILANPDTVTIAIVDPDGVATTQDPVTGPGFPAESYPNGFAVKDIIITTDQTCTDVVSIEEWSNNGTSWSETAVIESITLSGTRTEDDGTLSDDSVAADSYIRIDFQATPTDINQMTIVIVGAPNP